VRARKSGWSAAFTDVPPISIHGGRKLKTLADCREFILALPPDEQGTTHWQHATKVLLNAAEHGGPFVMIARIAFAKALDGTMGVDPPPPTKAKKQDRWQGRRKKR
jgi:hypothetical protein